MANQVYANTAEIRKKAQELHQLNHRFQSEINNLKSREARLNGMWDGDANDAFHREFLRDVTQMDAFFNASEKYVLTLYDISTKYDNAEQKNISGIAKH